MRLGPWEIALIVVLVILLFGSKKIPEVMRGFGSGIREFKKGLHEDENVSSSKPEESKKINDESAKKS
jgi:sec-independent protein translocase protein TatA